MDLLPLWIVPIADRESLAKGLLDIHGRWEEFVHNDLLPNYPKWVEKYAQDNKAEATDILRLAPTLDQVKQSTRFSFVSFSLAETEIQSLNLEEEVDGLWGQVLKEIASEIKDAHMHDSQTFTQAARAVLQRITRKCKGLGFLHPRLDEVSKTLDALMASMPLTGAIKGVEALAVKSVLDALLNPAQFMRTGFGIAEQGTLDLDAEPDADEPQDEVFCIAGDPSAQPVASAATEAAAAPVSLDDIFRAIPASTGGLEEDAAESTTADAVTEPAAAPVPAPQPHVPAVPADALAIELW